VEHLFNFHDRSIKVDYYWFDDLFAAERKELHRQSRGSLGRVAGCFHAPSQSAVRAYLMIENIAVPENDAEEIVEIMRNSASEPADGFHFLRLEELPFQAPALCYVFREDLKISRRISFLQDRMTGHFDSNNLPVFSSPLGFNIPKILFPPIVSDQALMGFWIATNIFFYVAPH